MPDPPWSASTLSTPLARRTENHDDGCSNGTMMRTGSKNSPDFGKSFSKPRNIVGMQGNPTESSHNLPVSDRPSDASMTANALISHPCHSQGQPT